MSAIPSAAARDAERDLSPAAPHDPRERLLAVMTSGSEAAPRVLQ